MRVLGVIVAVLLACAAAASEDEGGDDDEWLDPTDMLRYDPTSKTMRKFPPTDATHSAQKAECKPCPVTECKPCPVTKCSNGVSGNDQKKKIPTEDEQQSKKPSSPAQPLTHPILKRYLARLLKSVQKRGLPSKTSDVHYDVEIRLSEQSVTEIQKFLDGDGQVNPGVLDEIMGQLLLNMKHHDHEAWKWRFEDTFGVDLSTAVGVCICLACMITVICTELWSPVSWFIQLRRLFPFCFFVSLVWNWLYLYKMEYAKHQSKMMKTMKISEKCSGLKEFDWLDNFKGWYRGTFTVQGDECEEYYRAILVDPILLVPPNRVISYTITCLFTDPLEKIGTGVRDFFRALVSDIPFFLQIYVLIAVPLIIMFFLYANGQAVIQQVLPRLGGNREPAPLAVAQPQRRRLREEEEDLQGGGDSHIQNLRILDRERQIINNDGAQHQRKPSREVEIPPGRRRVENVGGAERAIREEEVEEEVQENQSLSSPHNFSREQGGDAEIPPRQEDAPHRQSASTAISQQTPEASIDGQHQGICLSTQETSPTTDLSTNIAFPQ